MSNFFICRKAWVTRATWAGVPCPIVRPNWAGTICQDSPYPSFS